jgi:small-conductance mechanosensitive channel
MEYLTIKEARELTGKSDSTIRRAYTKAIKQGKDILARDKGAILLDKAWVLNEFNISPIVDVVKSSPDFKILDVLQVQIKDQRNIITHQQEQITKLQDQVQDKSEKLEQSFMLISDIERKLIDTKNEQLNEQQKNKDLNKESNNRFEFIWLAGIILVLVIFLYLAFFKV